MHAFVRQNLYFDNHRIIIFPFLQECDIENIVIFAEF
jgi:hypothetical protein